MDKMKAAILKHGNPFAAEGNKPHNVITHAYSHDEYITTILNTNVSLVSFNYTLHLMFLKDTKIPPGARGLIGI